MSVRFTKIDNLTRSDHRFLDDDDDCSFLGEYTARKGYKYSDTNNYIMSLKMKPSVRVAHPFRWKYKSQAIDYWARKLSEALPLAEAKKVIWVPVPGSCPKDHTDYDDRLLKVLRRAYGTNINVLDLISQVGPRQAAHDLEERPTPERLVVGWTVDTSQLPPGTYEFAIFDDVIARGASFKAAQKLLLERYPGSVVAGKFLARNVHDDEPAIAFDMLTLFDES